MTTQHTGTSGFEKGLAAATTARISRRGMIKGLAAGAAVAKVAIGSTGLAKAAEVKDYKNGKWIASGCNMCGGQCSINVYVENGVVRKIEPLPAPGSVANVNGSAPYDYYDQAIAKGDLGRLCCKGNSGTRSLYDPDRVKTPLRRIGPRGSGLYEPISWEEAIAEAASKLKTNKSLYGAASLVWFGEDHSFTHIQQDFTDAYGCPNYSNHANLCDTSRKSAFKSTIGDERPLADFESAELLFIWGWNFLSAIKWIHLAAVFQRTMAKAGREFIYVDPVFNTTASKADQWIAPRPGTDGALAMALARHIIASGKYDTAFVGKYTLGFDEYKKFLNGETYDKVVKDAAWAEKVTGIPAGDIDALATKLETAFSAGKKILIDSWSGPGHHTNATQSGRAIAALGLLLGGVDKPGGLVFPKRSGPGRRSSSALGSPVKEKWRVDGRDDISVPQSDGSKKTYTKKYLYSHGSGIYVEQIERMLEQKDFVGNDYPIKACVIVFQNLLMSTPNTQKVINALNKMDFVMCVDTHLSETAMMADLVIPGSNYLERFDFNAQWISQRALGLRQPAVESWIGGRSEAQFFLDLGQAMGFKGFKDLPGVNDTDEAYNKEEWDRFMKTGNGGQPFTTQMTWDELKAKGYWVDAGGKTGFGQSAATKAFATATMTLKKYTVGSEVRYTVLQADTSVPPKYTAVGIVIDNSKVADDGKGGYTLPEGTTYEVGFKTTSRFGQFWDPVLNGAYVGTTKPAGKDVTGDVNFLPLPCHTEPLDKPSAQYPLYFLSWKEVEHAHTRTFNNPWLMTMRGENRLIIHPDVAKAYGIGEADRVAVESENGVVEARAHVAPIIHKECVGWVRGFGHWALGRYAKGKGAHDGWLLKGRAEIHSGQAVHKEAGCRIYKIG